MTTGVSAEPGGFDFTSRMRDLCRDISLRVPELAHVDVGRMAVSFSQARKGVAHGLQASLTPLRFRDGQREGIYRGQRVKVQAVKDHSGREMLYVLSFYLPRFLDLPFREKMVTVFHELWHISPRFDGDLRRFEGRCYAHTHSQAQYDAVMDRLAQRYFALDPPRAMYDFLRLDFAQIQQRHGRIIGVKLPRPKLQPAAE